MDYLMLDSSGQWLTAASGGSTLVYALNGLSQSLHVRCPVYWEESGIYGHSILGEYQYAMPIYNTKQLLTLAKEALTSPLGTRTLSQEELKYYELSE